MIVIPPLDIYTTHSRLVSSTIVEGTETDPPTEWNGTTVYSLGDRVYIPGSNNTPGRIYEALVGIVGGSIPSTDILKVTPRWAEVGPTNKWAMFDLLRDTISTVSTGSITVVLKPEERINSLAILNMDGVSEIKVSGIGLNSEILYPLNTINDPGTTCVLTDLPLNYNLQLSIEINGSGSLSVGSVVMGRSRFIGSIQSDVNIDSINFSEVDRDEFGNVSLISRRTIPKITKKLFAEAARVQSIILVRDLLNAIPAVWIGMENNEIPEYYNAFIVLGFYRGFTIVMDNPIGATIDIELEEI